ncbi:hypothetical protein ACMBCM_05620, partial [Spiroplasma sp. K1]
MSHLSLVFSSFPFLFIYLLLLLYIYIYMYVCICICIYIAWVGTWKLENWDLGVGDGLGFLSDFLTIFIFY